MLDFAKLKTPPHHGDVLMEPEPKAWTAAAHANDNALRRHLRPLLGVPLSEWRRRTREAIVGCDAAPVMVLGHQPGFVHPGVWAKHIAGSRLAAAVDGVAVHLIVDSDTPKKTSLAIPSMRDGHVVLRHVPYASLPAGLAYEQIPRQSEEDVARFARAVHEAMGDRFEGSQMPTFLEAFGGASSAGDWVDQTVAARRAVEASFGLALAERRVSTLGCTPLLADMLIRSFEFAASYNRALTCYRRANRVRCAHRPIPDLICTDDRCEVPYWVQRPDRGRRRLLVSHTGESLRLFAGEEEIGAVPHRRLPTWEDFETALAGLNGWRFRPRALALTIWARLLLADLFIHGIGGAKYDRISDRIIADYYGLAPPQVVCVSATLHLGFPTGSTRCGSVRPLRATLRDLQWNPQRHLPPGPDLDALMGRRAEVVRRAIELRAREPRNHGARHSAFAEIRGLNAAMLETRPGALDAARARLAAAMQELREGEIARGREYFFALYDRNRLEQLMAALPDERRFRV